MPNASTWSLGLSGGAKGDLRRRNDAIRALQGLGCLIYAVRTGDGLIKIGSSTDVVRRLMKIHGGVDELLALRPGSLATERVIHHDLRGHACSGREYYCPTPRVIATVNAMRSDMGLPTIDAEDESRRWRLQVWGS